MFPKKLYVYISEDGEVIATADRANAEDIGNSDEAIAVYVLKQTGTVIDERKIVWDKPRKRTKKVKRGRPSMQK